MCWYCIVDSFGVFFPLSWGFGDTARQQADIACGVSLGPGFSVIPFLLCLFKKKSEHLSFVEYDKLHWRPKRPAMVCLPESGLAIPGEVCISLSLYLFTLGYMHIQPTNMG